MSKLLSSCPVCASKLGISELSCTKCSTTIHGAFDPCRFCSLAPEHLSFVEMFLRCEGNISRIEKEMGISYPTVRNRLAGALAALGMAVLNGSADATQQSLPIDPLIPPQAEESAPLRSPEETAERRREVLNALARGEMTADEVANALRELT